MRFTSSLALLLGAAAASAQTPTATVRGIVIDQTDARLPKAQVTITRDETQETRRTSSDPTGYFTFAELPAGGYTIQAELAGFSVFRQKAQLAVGSDLWVQAQLAVATTAVVTTGVGDVPVPILERTPAMTTLVAEQQVLNLPLDGRNFLELALLAPGTAAAPQGSASSVRGDFALSVNGAREDFNNYILDGAYNVDPKLGTPAVRPPVDAIQEFEVATSTYDASFGRNAGGQINVLTRSGSNRFSGTGYEFFRSGGLAAKNHFAPGRCRSGLQPASVRRLHRRPDHAEPHVLLCRLRAHATSRGDHPCDECADGGGACRGLLSVALPGTRRSAVAPTAARRTHPAFLHSPGRHGNRRALSHAQSQRPGGQFRLVSDPARRCAPVRRQDRAPLERGHARRRGDTASATAGCSNPLPARRFPQSPASATTSTAAGTICCSRSPKPRRRW